MRRTQIKEKLIRKANEEGINLKSIEINIDDNWVTLDNWNPLAKHGKCEVKYKINSVNKYPKKVSGILKNGFKKNLMRTDQEWRILISEKWPECELLTKDKIERGTQIIELKCICGNIREIQAKLAGKKRITNCVDCGIKKRSLNRVKNAEKKFKEKVAQDNPNVKIVGEYRGSHVNIDCECKICDHPWPTQPTHLFGKNCTGCPECGQLRANLSSTISDEDIKKRINDSKPSCIIIPEDSVYQPSDKKKGIKYGSIDLLCLKHGSFKFTTRDLTRGTFCRSCGASKGEFIVMNYLDKNGISYEYNKFCQDKSIGRFDLQKIIIKRINIVIEIDGYPMHFDYKNKDLSSYNAFGLQKAKAVKGFIDRQIMDKKKNNYCIKQHNAILIRIPYTFSSQSKIHNFLDNIFNNIENIKQKIIYADRQIYINHAIKMGRVNCSIKTLQRKVRNS
tara:strand:+ start:2469 stop:3815 length:1347 start_codon:yes stop_codon:yes gene_type:complete